MMVSDWHMVAKLLGGSTTGRTPGWSVSQLGVRASCPGFLVNAVLLTLHVVLWCVVFLPVSLQYHLLCF